jgi:hypothetical protein
MMEGSFIPLQDLFSSPSGCFSVDSLSPISSVPKKTMAPAYQVGVSAMKLDKKDPGPTGKSDPFFEIRYTPKGQTNEILLYRSEVVKKNVNPTWKDFEIDAELIGSLDTPFHIRVFGNYC